MLGKRPRADLPDTSLLGLSRSNTDAIVQTPAPPEKKIRLIHHRSLSLPMAPLDAARLSQMTGGLSMASGRQKFQKLQRRASVSSSRFKLKLSAASLQPNEIRAEDASATFLKTWPTRLPCGWEEEQLSPSEQWFGNGANGCVRGLKVGDQIQPGILVKVAKPRSGERAHVPRELMAAGLKMAQGIAEVRARRPLKHVVKIIGWCKLEGSRPI